MHNVKLDKKMEIWKSRLLDFSKRNRLINFKATKSTIRIDRSTSEVFDLLDNEKALMVSSCIDIKMMANKQIQDKKELSNEELDKALTKSIPKVKQILEKQLNDIRLKGKSSIDEKGVNTLYLACGFLNWTEAEHSNINLKSPIFLVPLSIYRDTAREPYYMSKSDEVIFNPVLEQKLKIDYGVDVSSLEDLENETFEDLLKIYSKQVMIEPNWTVTSESYIGLFSFNKLVMFKDFEQYEDYIKGNHFIQNLAGIKQENDICERENIEDIKIHDQRGKSEESFQILDADSSQQEAILAAKKGVSFVMQGPPGTGKSQTITNIISESLAQGKKVLFVSEKKAALEVVKKRLDDKGLSDYCLDLHSHNSNKKAVLEEIKKSFNQKQSPTYNSLLFTEFDKAKQKLNQYVQSLHQTVLPLNETAQKIHGRLSALNNAPEVLFNIPEVNKINNERLTEMRKSLIRLEKMKSLIGKEDEHLWKGAIPQDTTYDLESTIQVHFNNLAKKIRELYTEFKETAEMVSFEGELNLSSIDHILDLNTMIINKPEAPSHWFGSEGKELLEKARNQFEYFESLFSSFRNLKEELFSIYKSEILNINHKIYDTISSKYKPQILNYTDQYEDFIDKIFQNDQKLKDSVDKIIRFYYEIDKFNQILHTLTKVHTENTNEKDIIFLEKFYDFIKDDPQPTKEWFKTESKEEIRRIIRENNQLFQSFHEEKQKLEINYDLSILDEDLEGILNRYTQEYSSFFRYFNKNFRRDNILIKSYLVKKAKLKHENIIKDLRSLKSFKKMKTQITNQNGYFLELFGKRFNGEKTNWKMISSHVEKIFSLNTFLINNNKKDIYLPFVLHIEDNQTIMDFKEIIDQLRALYQGFFEEVQNLRLEFMPKLCKLDESTNFLNFESNFHEIGTFINEIIDAKNEVASLFINSSEISFRNIDELFNKVRDINRLEEEIKNHSGDLSLLYGELFIGYDTDWKSVKDAINWTVNAEKNYAGWFPASFVDIINDSNKFACFSKRCFQLERKRESLENQIDFYQKIFPFYEEKFNGQSFFNAELSQMTIILNSLAGNVNKLQEWITYQEARSNVVELGLKDFINKIIEEEQLNASFEKVFLKRFYQLWLDHVYKALPALKHFRIDQHQRLLREFKENDLNQININGARLHGILTAKKESYIETTAYTSSSSNLAILKREIQKQKKHKSIRKLFSIMPELIMALKPCMMMSPLSVSQFVDPSKLSFDVVIFDEASQIRPEDAIGTIMRGKQLIVAGDDKQLPPTSFFASQIEMDEEFIEEDDEEVYENFESILDECLLFMPQISLKWHYRSKQESLIAFSNKEIYNNELYTFPNSIRSEHDGISHIYVENGVYDRGKSKKNLKEAEKVAELVFEHIERSKNRSLGIITFSEPQQVAIRDKIDELRQQHPEYEDFFNENHLESFFVKNIENVQGDERDTIIISVGYAKDIHGQMYYNFGPLNHDGGERRLNVAVSRAKKEIKVVSSILDIDLDDAKLNKQGTKLLKSYLAYAKSNGEFSYNVGIEDDADFDSPFEEDVYRTLQRKGLELRKQVGCSGYRIDLAVVDPKFPGQYILGIECDGATYHSSKTARDRDRLRQSVLESLGWRIERIWSQDWVKRKQEIADSIANKVKGEFINI